MNQKTIITIILSTIAGALAALIVCAFFFFYDNPAQTAENMPLPVEKEPPPALRQTKTPTKIEAEKIMLSEIDSLSVSTSFTGFYDAGSECGKSRTPSPAPEDTVALSYSPCRTRLTFNRRGAASKSVVVKRVKNGREEEEKAEWKSEITAEQFETLLKGVAFGKDFIAWELMSTYHSNGTIYAEHPNGTAQLPLYIDLVKGSSLKPALDAFRELDREIVWQKV